MVKTIFSENLFNNILRPTSLIACLAGLLFAIAAKATGRHGRQAFPASLGRRVSQIATAIFLPRPDAIDFVKTASIGESRYKPD